MKTLYKNGFVLCESFNFIKTDIAVSDDTIAEIGDISSECEKTIDCDGKYIVPGFVDIHTHGCLGIDNADSLEITEIDKMSGYFASKGVTTYLPTIATSSAEGTENAVKSILCASNLGTSGANIGGIYLEGPYFSKKFKGAQNEEYMRLPDIEEFMRLFEISDGIIKVISLAPELEQASEFIKAASKYAKIAIGHTDSDYETAKCAIENGASLLTHSFNAMRPLHHRNPNAIGAALESGIFCEFICDGIHISPTLIKLAYRLISDERMVFVSDSISAAGMTDGEYTLCGLKYIVKYGKAHLPDGTIAGSTSNLHEAVKNAVSYGIPLESAVKIASFNPSKACGIDNICGSISVGKRADLLILGKNLEICDVFVSGKRFDRTEVL